MGQPIDLTARRKVTVPTFTQRYRCSRPGCGADCTLTSQGYEYEHSAELGPSVQQHEAAQAGVLHTWAHAQDTRTFTQAELFNGAASDWLDSLHPGSSPRQGWDATTPKGDRRGYLRVVPKGDDGPGDGRV